MGEQKVIRVKRKLTKSEIEARNKTVLEMGLAIARERADNAERRVRELEGKIARMQRELDKYKDEAMGEWDK